VSIWRQLARFLGTDGEMTNISPGNTAPGFSLKGLDGKEYSLHSLTQKGPVVAAFFKISCPVCQFTFPFLERLHKRHGGDGATFLGISQDDARGTKSFASESGVTFPMALDDRGYPASNAYGLTSVPTVFLIDTDGKVKLICMGFDKKSLETIATELAERRKVAPTPLFHPGESVPAHKPG
jgi:peroxiredoxin